MPLLGATEQLRVHGRAFLERSRAIVKHTFAAWVRLCWIQIASRAMMPIVLRRRMVPTLCALSCATMLALSSGSGFADPSASDKETARALMKDGDTKRTKGDHRGALLSFRAAHAIMNVPTTGLELGRTENELGLLVEARDTLLSVTRLPVVVGESENMRDAREEAQKLSDSIEPRIPSLTIRVEGLAEGVAPRVTVDGTAILAATLGVPRKHNPGTHTIVVVAGSTEKRETVDLVEHDEKTLTISMSAPATSSDDPPAEAPAPSRISPLVYVGFGSAALFGALGGVTGLVAFSRANSAKEGCDGTLCPPSTHDDIESSRTFGTVSTISFALAGAGAVVGVIGLFSRAPAPPPEPTARGVHLLWGLGSIGVAGAF